MSIVPWKTRARPYATSLAGGFLLLLLALMIYAYPRAQDYLRAVSLLRRVADPHATGWIANYHVHPVDARDTTFNFHGSTIAARIYQPRGLEFAPGIMVVHGMQDLGIEDPRLISFARSLAATGFLVMTPQVPGIADYRVTRESADLIGNAAQSFAREIHAQKVGVLAFSFSGGLALLAASDSQYASVFAWVATVGAYYDLTHVLRFFATADAIGPDGKIDHTEPNGYGPLIVVYDEAQDFFAPQDVQTARQAMRQLLQGGGQATEELLQTLTPADQQTMQRIYHDQREAFTAAILSEIDKRKAQLAAASPAGHMQSLQVPVLLLHGSDDSVIPPTELLWLQRNVPHDELLDALISPAMSHVEVDNQVSWRDRMALVRWVSLVIREARESQTGPAPLPAGAWLASAPACSNSL